MGAGAAPQVARRRVGRGPAFGSLLRQSHGFEGLVWVEVGSNPNSLSVLELDHRAVGRFDFGLACRATRADAPDCDHPVTKVPDLRVVGVELREGLVQVSEPI